MPSEAAPARLLVDALPEAGSTHTLDPASSHYVTRVCRARAGEWVTLTDGRGGVARGRLAGAGSGLVVRVESSAVTPAPRPTLLLCGAPEGERADWLVEKLAELGAGTLVPVDTERARWQRFSRRSGRFERLAAAALRQSERDRLLAIRAPLALAQALRELPAGRVRWVGVAGSERVPEVPDGSDPLVGLIGPSPGLSEGELGMARESGFQPICLADGRLRTETAAVAMAARWAGSRLLAKRGVIPRI